MNKEELTMISFEIVSYSGDARSKLLLALEKAKKCLFLELSSFFMNISINIRLNK